MADEGIARADLRQLARSYLRDAELLYSGGRWANAYYLSGYAAEMALKARVCKHLGLIGFPPTIDGDTKKYFQTHSFERLLMLGGLQAAIRADPVLDANWSIIRAWSPESRYRPVVSQTEARALLDALRSAEKGLVTWLARRS